MTRLKTAARDYALAAFDLFPLPCFSFVLLFLDIFLIGLSKAINLLGLSAIVCGLQLICEKTGANLWKLYKVPSVNED